MQNSKILCLGNNTKQTDDLTSIQAVRYALTNKGMIPAADFIPIEPGVYHSSIYDITRSDLLTLAQRFDRVIVLDQPIDQWNEEFSFKQTIELANELEQYIPVEFINTQYTNNPKRVFKKILDSNKSFCLLPFVELLAQNGNTTVCCKSLNPITKLENLKSWTKDDNYIKIRQQLLAGESIPDHCSWCYSLEDKGIMTPRYVETLDWAERLNLTSVEDLSKIEHPVYYEVRASNVCNLQCRMCYPFSSNLIEKEYIKIGLHKEGEKYAYTGFDIVNIDWVEKLYVSGGEPTAQPEFYEFLEKCIAKGRTNFEFIVNTNAVKINQKLRDLLKNFTNLNFNVSLDGYDKVNHYIRWPSEWNTTIANVRALKEDGHNINFATAISIYNITNLYDLFNFIDNEFPGSTISSQIVILDLETRPKDWGDLRHDRDDFLSPFIYPLNDIALTNLTKITTLDCYKNNSQLKSMIDGLIEQFKISKPVNQIKLDSFFKFNDLLDQSRDVKLKDYIPELEACRNYLTKQI